MKSILKTDLVIFFTSPMGYVIPCVWLLILSSLLWIFPGDYNIPDGGYASLSSFFFLASMLLAFLVPAVTMRLLAEEKRSGTMELVLFRPLSIFKIILSKYLVGVSAMLLTLLPALVYVVCVDRMSVNGLDMGEVIGGYVGMICLILAFTAIGVFSSSLTSNQLLAFLLGALICFFCYFGFDLLAALSGKGSTYNTVSGLGISSHYNSMIRGVVDTRDLIYFFTLTLLFLILTYFSLSSYWISKKTWLRGVGVVSGLILLNVVFTYLYIRFDFTEEKRYTLSPHTRELMKGLDQPLEAVLYLDGDLNPAFDGLKRATIALLEELSQQVPHGIILKQINPGLARDENGRQQNYLRMEQAGMEGLTVNERDRQGKVSSRVIFPWLEFVYKGDTIPVNLLKRNIALSSYETLNSSIEELEYKLTDAIRILQSEYTAAVAFIEGHGEWEEPYVYEATEILSRYYQVDRGAISGDPEELYPYKVLIIASPRSPFSEAEKFALDQYLMQGGSLLFFMDGVQISEEEFNGMGESVTLKSEVNLDDMLFTYGVRVNPLTVMDMNCSSIRLASSQSGAKETFVTLPWYFAPLLEPSSESIITRNISPLKSELVSTISFVGEDHLKKQVILTSSFHSQVLPVPEKISLRYVEMPADPVFFDKSYLPVAGLIEGRFTSVFRNRNIPDSSWVEPGFRRMDESVSSRLMVVASASLIKNEWRGQGRQTVPLPLGYDPITDEQLGNADFLMNAVNYLAGNEEWLNLRIRNYKLRLLNKQEITTGLLKWQIINTIVPLIFVLLSAIIFIFLRTHHYGR